MFPFLFVSMAIGVKMARELVVKIKPKSCSCSECTRGKHSDKGRILMNYDERRVRRAVNQELKKIVETLDTTDEDAVLSADVETLVPIGNYYD